jgi:ribosomal protein S18 acetylase RimI-like enzyme
MSAADAIVQLDPDDSEHVLAAAELHMRLLGNSPIPRLGRLFMTQFFYSQLVRDGLIHCYLYRLNEGFVGFLSFTEKPYLFMSEGTRLNFFRLSFILCLALLVKPSRLRILWETFMVARRKKRTTDCDGIGELLSFGVLEEYATKRDGGQGLRIPNLLFDEGIRHFRERGFRRIEWTVDKDNLPAMIFYRSYGATLEKSAAAWPGDYRVRLEL